MREEQKGERASLGSGGVRPFVSLADGRSKSKLTAARTLRMWLHSSDRAVGGYW